MFIRLVRRNVLIDIFIILKNMEGIGIFIDILLLEQGILILDDFILINEYEELSKRREFFNNQYWNLINEYNFISSKFRDFK